MTSPYEAALETIKLRNHHISLLIWAEGGRILEVKSLESGADLVSWWPYMLGHPEGVGGIGERSIELGASPYRCRRDDDALILTRCLLGGLTLVKTITLPADSMSFGVSIKVSNDSGKTRSFVIDQTAAVCPGFGGACPREASGISHCHEKAFLKRPSGQTETVYYEVFEKLRVERDDLEWAAFVDPVSHNMLSAILPEGHCVLRTNYHWWLDWSRELTLDPHERFSADFYFTVTGHVDICLLYTSPSPRDRTRSRMPSSA